MKLKVTGALVATLLCSYPSSAASRPQIAKLTKKIRSEGTIVLPVKSSALRAAAAPAQAAANEFPYGNPTLLEDFSDTFAQVIDTDIVASVDGNGKTKVFFYPNSFVGYIDPATGDFLSCDYLRPRGQYQSIDVIDCYQRSNLSQVADGTNYPSGAAFRRGSYFYYENGRTLTTLNSSYWYYSDNTALRSGSYIYYRNGRTFSSSGSSYAYFPNGNSLRSGSYMYFANGNTFKNSSSTYYLNGSYVSRVENEYYHPGASSVIAAEYNTNNMADFFYANAARTYLKHDVAPFDGRLYYQNGSESFSFVNYTNTVTGIGSIMIDAERDRDLLAITMADTSATYAVVRSRVAPATPGIPANVSVSAIGTKSATVNWQAGTGSAPASYRIKIQTGNVSALDCVGAEDVNLATSKVFSGLLANQAYTVAVCATNASGVTSLPARTYFTTQAVVLPPAPTNLQKAAGDFRSLTLAWSTGGGNTQDFIVAYAAGNSAPSCSNGTVTSATQLALNNLTDNTNYSFGVCARNSDGALSSQASITLKTNVKPIPPVVGGLSAIAKTDASLTVSWASGGGDTTGFKAALAQGNQTGLSCEATGSANVALGAPSRTYSQLLADTDYTVAVCAVNQYGFVSASSRVLIHTDKVPAIVNASIGNIRASFFVLNWASGGGGTSGYVVKVVPGAMGNPACAGGTSTSQASYTFTGLTEQTAYTWMVCAKNASGQFSVPVTGSVTTPAAVAPADPSNLQVVSTDFRSASLSWVSGVNETAGFKVAFAKGGAAPDCRTGTAVLASQNQFTVTGLEASSNYAFSLCAYSQDNVYSTQLTANGVTQEIPIPAQPANFTAVAFTDTAIDLSWAAGDASTTGYAYSVVQGETAPTSCGTAVSGTSLRLNRLAVDTEYSFALCSVNQYGFKSAPVTATASTLEAMQAPPVANLELLSSGIGSLTFNWDSGGGNTDLFRYGIKEGRLANLQCSDATTDTRNSDVTIAKLKEDQDYTIVVCAKSESGLFSPATLAYGLTKAKSPRPLNFHVVSKHDTAIRLAWDAAGPEAKRYYLSWRAGVYAPACAASGPTVEAFVNAPITEYEIKGLKPNVNYSISICGITATGVKSKVVTLVEMTTTLQTPPAPRDISVAMAGGTSIQWKWSSGGGNTNVYLVAVKAGVNPTLLCTAGAEVTVKNAEPVLYKKTGLLPDAPYTVAICAKSASKQLSAPLVFTEGRTTPPPAVLSLKSTSVKKTTASFTWKSAKDGTAGYLATLSEGSVSPGCSGAVRAGASFAATKLKANTAYTMTVCARGKNASLSTPAVVQITTLP